MVLRETDGETLLPSSSSDFFLWLLHRVCLHHQCARSSSLTHTKSLLRGFPLPTARARRCFSEVCVCVRGSGARPPSPASLLVLLKRRDGCEKHRHMSELSCSETWTVLCNGFILISPHPLFLILPNDLCFRTCSFPLDGLFFKKERKRHQSRIVKRERTAAKGVTLCS